MASLREITQINPNTVVYDERTKQYHDTANRYRMVKRTIAEKMQNNISAGTPTRKNNDVVSQTTFDAFRKDVYLHISETARFAKISIEELKKSLDYQTKETDRLQRMLNQVDENRQENLIERIYDNRDIRNERRNRRSGDMSFTGLLGLSAAGLIGSFLASSLLMTPQQIRTFGQDIDNVLGMLPDIQNVIDNFNNINSAIQSVFNFFTPENRDPNYGMAGGGVGEGGTPQLPPPPSPPPPAPTPRPQPSPLFADADARAIAAANPRPRPTPQTETAGDRMRAAQTAQTTRESGGTPGSPQRSYVEGRNETERLSHERNEQRLIERTQGAPEIPEAVISRILFGSETLEQIRQMRAREGAYSGMSEREVRTNIVNMIDSALRGADRQFIAMAIRESIENHRDLHGSAEVAARIVQYSDEAGSTRAAENLYDIFFDREVIGQRRARGPDLISHLDATRSQRSNQLRTRIVNFNSRRASLSQENINSASQLTPSGSGGSITVATLPPIGINQPQRSSGQTVARQTTTPSIIAPPIQTTNLDPTFAAFRASMGLAIA